MKIVMITGSPHRHGTSALLADAFIQGAQEAGHTVFRFDAAFQELHPCRACERCHNTDKGCIYKDGMEELNPHLLEADLVAFASPIYYYDWSAQLKLAIDRFYANSTALRTPKKAVLLLTMEDDTMRGSLLPGHDQLPGLGAGGGDFRPLLWGLGGHGAHRLSPTGL